MKDRDAIQIWLGVRKTEAKERVFRKMSQRAWEQKGFPLIWTWDLQAKAQLGKRSTQCSYHWAKRHNKQSWER